MVIRDTPSDLDKFFMADEELAFELEQKGFKPVYMDYSAVYFKKTQKLLKFLQKLNYEL